jgi:hypothetical protein
MDRRRFLKASVIAGGAGAAALSSSSCSSLLPRYKPASGDVELPDMDQYIAQVDRGLKHIEQWDPAAELSEAGSDSEHERINNLARNAVKALYISAMFTDLPEEARSRPGMQARIKKALPEIDATATEVADYLGGLTASDREKLHKILSRRENPGMQIFEQFDKHAAENGVTLQRRLHTRATANNILWRLKNQPPDLLFDEYQVKIEKLAASESGSMTRPEVAARLAEKAFWKWSESLDDGGADQDEEKKDYRTAKRGARMMGIGVVIFGVGGAIVAAGGFPGVFVMTVGAVWFLIGLIVAIVGLISA